MNEHVFYTLSCDEQEQIKIIISHLENASLPVLSFALDEILHQIPLVCFNPITKSYGDVESVCIKDHSLQLNLEEYEI